MYVRGRERKQAAVAADALVEKNIYTLVYNAYNKLEHTY